MIHLAVLLAGGTGSRMNHPHKDKLLNPINGTNAFRLSYQAFLNSRKVENAIIVYRDSQQKEMLSVEIELVHKQNSRTFLPIWVKGGVERKDSVSNALINCPANCEFVYVHDCARPMIQSNTIDQLEQIVSKVGAVAIARPVSDTIKKISHLNPKNTEAPCKTESIDRSSLWIMETPQVSRKDWLLEGIQLASKKKLQVTDEVSLLELIGKKVSLLTPSYPNPKLTSVADLPYFKFLIPQK
ncbi:2-C-methyl-D-erythritol 4-phosphate cytidylyltransferase [Opitutales bacterium]|nr:2-C-methyl-D-erythritol 4-phosphate cytidylyltransferase [Opitutales bacterium]